MRAVWMAWVAAGVLLGTAGGGTVASEAVPAGPVGRLQAWLDGTSDLECRFEQRLVSTVLGGGTRESGTFYLRRPGRLRWEYTDPEPKTALVEGERTLLYLPEDRQLIRGRLSPEQDLLPALLAGRGRIVELFEATVLEGTDSAARGAVRIRLVPRATPEGVREIVLTLTADYAIDRAEVLDPVGGRMEYLFTKVRRNRGVPNSVFAFEPPPGTEIVESP